MLSWGSSLIKIVTKSCMLQVCLGCSMHLPKAEVWWWFWWSFFIVIKNGVVTRTICNDETIILECGSGTYLDIKESYYGRKDPKVCSCSTVNAEQCQTNNATSIIRAQLVLTNAFHSFCRHIIWNSSIYFNTNKNFFLGFLKNHHVKH